MVCNVNNDKMSRVHRCTSLHIIVHGECATINTYFKLIFFKTNKYMGLKKFQKLSLFTKSMREAHKTGVKT